MRDAFLWLVVAIALFSVIVGVGLVTQDVRRLDACLQRAQYAVCERQ